MTYSPSESLGMLHFLVCLTILLFQLVKAGMTCLPPLEGVHISSLYLGYDFLVEVSDSTLRACSPGVSDSMDIGSKQDLEDLMQHLNDVLIC